MDAVQIANIHCCDGFTVDVNAWVCRSRSFSSRYSRLRNASYDLGSMTIVFRSLKASTSDSKGSDVGASAW